MMLRSFDIEVAEVPGRGNLISRVSNLKSLGLKTKKEIPDNFREDEDDRLSN